MNEGKNSKKLKNSLKQKTSVAIKTNKYTEKSKSSNKVEKMKKIQKISTTTKLKPKISDKNLNENENILKKIKSKKCEIDSPDLTPLNNECNQSQLKPDELSKQILSRSLLTDKNTNKSHFNYKKKILDYDEPDVIVNENENNKSQLKPNELATSLIPKNKNNLSKSFLALSKNREENKLKKDYLKCEDNLEGDIEKGENKINKMKKNNMKENSENKKEINEINDEDMELKKNVENDRIKNINGKKSETPNDIKKKTIENEFKNINKKEKYKEHEKKNQIQSEKKVGNQKLKKERETDIKKIEKNQKNEETSNNIIFVNKTYNQQNKTKTHVKNDEEKKLTNKKDLELLNNKHEKQKMETKIKEKEKTEITKKEKDYKKNEKQEKKIKVNYLKDKTDSIENIKLEKEKIKLRIKLSTNKKNFNKFNSNVKETKSISSEKTNIISYFSKTNTKKDNNMLKTLNSDQYKKYLFKITNSFNFFVPFIYPHPENVYIKENKRIDGKKLSLQKTNKYASSNNCRSSTTINNEKCPTDKSKYTISCEDNSSKNYNKTDYNQIKNYTYKNTKDKELDGVKKILLEKELKQSYRTLSNSQKNLLKEFRLNNNEFKSFILNKKNMGNLVFPIFYNYGLNENGNNTRANLSNKNKKIINKKLKLPEINNEK